MCRCASIGIVPSTENMPGGRAIKPGDVLRSASGKTVEVMNTDAEGRLVLGDGLWYAQQLGATHLVDVATLTGACVVALGRWASGSVRQAGRMGRDRARARRIAPAERAWPLPVHDEYFDQLKSDWADMSNSGGRPAGAVTAAVFLKQFAGELPWAHLDIAGTVWVDDAKPWQSKGATGTAVRTLVEVAMSQARAPAHRARPADAGPSDGTPSGGCTIGCRAAAVQPIIVRVVGQPAQELGLGQIIAQALGLTGIILILSLLLGLLRGRVFIWLRVRRPARGRIGEAVGSDPPAARATRRLRPRRSAAGVHSI